VLGQAQEHLALAAGEAGGDEQLLSLHQAGVATID